MTARESEPRFSSRGARCDVSGAITLRGYPEGHNWSSPLKDASAVDDVSISVLRAFIVSSIADT